MAGKLVFDLLPVAKLRAKYVEIIYTVLRDLVEALAREPTKKVALVYEDLDHSKFAKILARCNAQEKEKRWKKITEEETLAQLKEERSKGEIQRASNILGFHRVGDEWQIREDAAAPIGLGPGKTKPFTTAV